MTTFAHVGRVTLAFAALFVFAWANAQDVLEKRFSTGIHWIEKSAAEASRSLPLISAGESGTVVTPHYSHHRILIDLIGGPDDKEVLLRAARAFASRADFPKADFTYFSGKTVSAVRIDFGDYVGEGRRRHFDISLAALRSSITQASEPTWLAIAPDEANVSKLDDRIIEDHTFIPISELGNKTLSFTSEVPWYSELVIAVVMLLFIGSAFAVSRQIIVGASKETIDPRNIVDPDTVQASYGRSRHHIWFGCAFFAAILCGGFLLISALPSSLNAISNANWLLIPILISAGSLPISLVIRWLRGTKGASSPGTRKLVLAMTSFAWIALSVLASLLLMFFAPDAIAKFRIELLVMTLSAPVLAVATFVVGSILMSKKYNVPLPHDHHLRAYAVEIAQGSGTKLRDIYTTDLPGANALMTISGRLALSDDLMANLDDAELRAIIAHEIGHHRHRDVAKLLVSSIVLFSLVFIAHQWFVARFGNLRDSMRFLFLLAPMTAIIPYVLLGKRRRQAEFEADRFAVRMTGDPELVIRALTKVTRLNESPGKLTRFDEALSTHPSLESRIASIRAASEAN